MKQKVALGLGGAFVAILLGLAAFFYFTVFRPAQSVMADLDQMAGLKVMNGGVWNREAFLTPPGEDLSEEQVARFSRVQTAVRIGLGPHYPLLDERAKRLRGLAVSEDGRTAVRELGVRDAILAFKGLGPALTRTKELQVNALNTEGFSVEEYRWVRESFYRALGFTLTGIYLEDFAAGLKESRKLDFGVDAPWPAPSEHNRELVAAYGDSIGPWFPFLVFGF